MTQEPDSQPRPSDTCLRDTQAVYRTKLANQRTFLAYVRTALALVAGGVTGLYFEAPLATALGWPLIALGGLTLVVGIHQYLKMRRLIERAARLDLPPHDDGDDAD